MRKYDMKHKGFNFTIDNFHYYYHAWWFDSTNGNYYVLKYNCDGFRSRTGQIHGSTSLILTSIWIV